MNVRTQSVEVPDVLVFEPSLFEDERGHLFEAWNKAEFAETVGGGFAFVQDNQSLSRQRVLRGLHYQLPNPQGKLVRAVIGEVFSVAVDIRRSSASFGRWCGIMLSAENRKQLWLPPGFAHGILAMSERAEIIYKVTAFYAPGCDRAIQWNDPEIGIEWPLAGVDPLISGKDRTAPPLSAAEVYE